jgi:hypothetical protein
MHNANVGHGESKMDKLVRRRKVPCVRRLWSLYRERVVSSAVPLSMERGKRDQEVKKKQTIKVRKVNLNSQDGD